MKYLKLWLSSLFYRMCLPYIEKEVASIVEYELGKHYRLTRDVKGFILEELNRRVPVEGTTHALACHVRDHARKLEKRLDWLDGHLVVDSRHERG